MYLEDCIKSICSQKVQDFELILIDDGSPDNCPKMCDEWVLKDNRIRVIHKNNGGLSDARNAGLSIAKGKYIWFVDSDDWIDECAIVKIKECILTVDSDLIAMQIVEVCDGKYSIYGSYPSFRRTGTTMTNKEYALMYPILPSVRFIINRKFLLDNNITFIKGILHEDIPFCHMIISKSNKLTLLKDPTYFYRIRVGSITTTPRIDSCYSLVKAYEQFLIFMRENDLNNIHWINLLKYDYFHEIFIKLYPFIGKIEYYDFMDKYGVYIKQQMNSLWRYISLKRKILILFFNISPRLYSYILSNKFWFS